MPRAEIACTQALHTLSQLHAELAGKLLDNAAERKRLTTAMLQVEAVMKMLAPGYDVRPIAVRRRKPNPWFKRGTVFRAAIDVIRTASGPLTAQEIATRMVVSKGVQNPDRKSLRDLAGSVLSSLRNHRGGTVDAVGLGHPYRWQLIEP